MPACSLARVHRSVPWPAPHGNASLLLQSCKTKYLEKQVKQIATKSATFAGVLVALERQHTCYQTDLSIHTEIRNLAMSSNNRKAARMSEVLADLDHWVGRLTPRLYSSHERLFVWWQG